MTSPDEERVITTCRRQMTGPPEWGQCFREVGHPGIHTATSLEHGCEMQWSHSPEIDKLLNEFRDTPEPAWVAQVLGQSGEGGA